MAKGARKPSPAKKNPARGSKKSPRAKSRASAKKVRRAPVPKAARKSAQKGTRKGLSKSTPAVTTPDVARVEKADGDLAVRAYITSLAPWMREVARRFDLLVDQEAPNVRRTVKSRAILYGVPGQGWFASMKALTGHIKVIFLAGAGLKPVPPTSLANGARGIDLHASEPLDEETMRSWIRQAASRPGRGQ